MKSFALNNDHFLTIEKADLFLRLVILKKEKEICCRKVNSNAFLKMVKNKTTQIFKGRLQLHFFENAYNVVCNNKALGKIELNELFD